MRRLALLLPARALVQRFSNLSVHQTHVENLIKQIAGSHLQRSGLFLLSGWGRRIGISRGQCHASAAGNFAITLCSRLPFTPAEGACQGLITHQVVGDFTMDIDELGLGGNSW